MERATVHLEWETCNDCEGGGCGECEEQGGFFSLIERSPMTMIEVDHHG